MPEYTIVDLPVIESLADPGWGWAYHGLEALDERVCQVRYGVRDRGRTAQQYLGFHQQQSSTKNVLLVAYRGGGEYRTVVGRAWVDLPLDANLTHAEFDIEVDPDLNAGPLWDELLDRCETIASHHDRSVAILECAYGAADEHGAVLIDDRGGRVPRDSEPIARAVRRGYRLTQAEQESMLELPLVPELLGSLQSRIVDDGRYRLQRWTGPTPSGWCASYGKLIARFATLAPNGDIEMQDEVWDEARVRQEDKRQIAAGQVQLRVVAEEIATRELIAMTSLHLPQVRPAVAQQGMTLVLPDHRGHQLGLWLKLTNLAELIHGYPQVRRCYTQNTQSSQHMLAINELLGFRTIGGSATMLRTLN